MNPLPDKAHAAKLTKLDYQQWAVQQENNKAHIHNKEASRSLWVPVTGHHEVTAIPRRGELLPEWRGYGGEPDLRVL